MKCFPQQSLCSSEPQNEQIASLLPLASKSEGYGKVMFSVVFVILFWGWDWGWRGGGCTEMSPLQGKPHQSGTTYVQWPPHLYRDHYTEASHSWHEKSWTSLNMSRLDHSNGSFTLPDSDSECFPFGYNCYKFTLHRSRLGSLYPMAVSGNEILAWIRQCKGALSIQSLPSPPFQLIMGIDLRWRLYASSGHAVGPSRYKNMF